MLVVRQPTKSLRLKLVVLATFVIAIAVLIFGSIGSSTAPSVSEFTFGSIHTERTHRRSWPSVPYTEVRAYAYKSAETSVRSILQGEELTTKVLNPDGIALSQSQADRLVRAVSDYHPSSINEALCFNPRHVFIFYDATHKPVAQVQVCFECHNSECIPFIGEPSDIRAMADICYELKVPNNPGPNYTYGASGAGHAE